MTRIHSSLQAALAAALLSHPQAFEVSSADASTPYAMRRRRVDKCAPGVPLASVHCRCAVTADTIAA
jgi:hypothetical protein